MWSVLCLIGLAPLNVAAHVKGVSPQDQPRYVPDKDGFFACLGDPTIRIPFDRVNDDYCDCPDGSDEPGTSACSNGRFWCNGSQQYVPSRIVGDNVCDYALCCDGSDELPGLCPDRCEEVRAKLAQQEEERQQFFRDGVAKRDEIVRKAESRKQELADLVEELKAKMRKGETELSQALKDLEKAHEQDKESSYDAESVDAIGELRDVIQQAETDLVKFNEYFVELREAFQVLDAAFDQMSVDYNPNFNDPAVKEAIKIWKKLQTPNLHTPPRSRNYLESIGLLDKIKIASEDEAQRTGSEDFDRTQPLSSWGQQFARQWLPPVLSSLILPAAHESQHSGNAGVQVQRMELKIKELNEHLKETQESLNLNGKLLAVGEKFWGPGEIGHGVEETCVNVQRGDFNYEVCLFGNAVQLDGYHRVELGHSTGLKETKDGRYVIEFEGGNECPNKIRRSLTLNLECGLENKAYHVEEPEVCHYVVLANSPIACKPAEGQKLKIEHQEL